MTGQPGAGKSALLGHVLFHCHPELWGLPAGVGPRIDSAILARGKSTAALFDELATELDSAATDARALGESLADGVAVLIDALDEAESPDAVIHELLTPLLDGAARRMRLLLGTRRDQLAKLPFAYQTVDLDTPEFFRGSDVGDYVRAVLRHEPGPYKEDAEAAAAAAELVAERAGGSFLIARVAARTLARSARALTEDEVRAAARLWDEVGRAFDQDLARYGVDAAKVRDLLLPLAYARGAGLPWETVWAPVASALADVAYDDDDVEWLQRNVGSYIVEATEDGAAVYRLVHQELAKHLRHGSDAEEANRRIVDALLGLVPADHSGRRAWRSAHRYLRRHLAGHAADGGRIDILLDDTGFVLAADPLALARAALRARTPEAAAVAAVHRLALERLVDGSPPERAAALGLAASQRGLDDLAAAVTDVEPNAPWRTLWADWQGHDPHRTLTRMPAAITCVAALDDDGRTLIAAAAERTVRVIDEELAEVVKELTFGARVECLGVAAAQGERLLLAGTADGCLQVIRTRDWSVTVLRAHEGELTAVTTARLAGELVVATGGRAPGPGLVPLWDVRGSAGARVVATGARGRGPSVVRLWDVRGSDASQWAARYPEHVVFGGSVRRLHLIENDGRTLLLAAGDPLDEPKESRGLVRLIDPLSGALVEQIQVPGVALVNTDPDAGGVMVRTYMGGAFDRLSAWDLRTGAETAVAEPDHGSSMTLARVLAGGSPACAISTSQTVELRDPATLELLPGWRPITIAHVTALCPALGGQHLVTGGEDGAVRLWDLGWRETTAGAPAAHRGARLIATGPSSRGPLAIVAGPAGTEMRGARNGERYCTLLDSAVEAIAVTEQRVYLAGRGAIRSFRFDGTPGAVSELQAGRFLAMASSVPGGRSVLALACDDYTVRLLDPDTGDRLSPPLRQSGYRDKTMYAVAFMTIADTRALVAAGATGDLVAWKLDGFEECELPGGSSDYVRALAVATDGVLYCGGDAAELVAVDVRRLTVKHRRKRAHDGWIQAICVSGPYVVSGARDGVLRIWDRSLEEQLAIPLDSEITSIAAVDGVIIAGTLDGTVALEPLQPWHAAAAPA